MRICVRVRRRWRSCRRSTGKLRLDPVDLAHKLFGLILRTQQPYTAEAGCIGDDAITGLS